MPNGCNVTGAGAALLDKNQTIFGLKCDKQQHWVQRLHSFSNKVTIVPILLHFLKQLGDLKFLIEKACFSSSLSLEVV